MDRVTAFLRECYRFKPLRTFAQVLAPAVAGSAIFEVPWGISLGLAASAGVASFLQIIGEGGELFADDKRVTGTRAGA